MKVEMITERDDLLIRRLILDPGEPMFWHIDACHRFSVVVRGSQLAIEYKDSGEVLEFEVYPGMAGWETPEERVHRAINKGNDTYEEVVTFYRSGSDIDPQPTAKNDGVA
jgi:hypothetical protein